MITEEIFPLLKKDDGSKKITIHLNRSYQGLYVPKMVWREMRNFSTNSVAMVIASTDYDERDYIRDYGEFKLKIDL